MAYFSEKGITRFLKCNGLSERDIWQKASTYAGFIETLAKIKSDAMAITNLKNRHKKGFAVPIFINKKVVAGLSIFLPEYRCTVTHEQDIIQELKKVAHIISQQLTNNSTKI